MLAFSIEAPDVKVFMNKLLKEQTFDAFQVKSVEIKSIATFEIDASIHKDYLPEDSPDRKFCKWNEIRPYVFNIIKGTQKPRAIKIVFSYDPSLTLEPHPNAAALFLNIYFENNKINCTTATSQINFSLNKDVDAYWNDFIKVFFKDNSIVISTH